MLFWFGLSAAGCGCRLALPWTGGRHIFSTTSSTNAGRRSFTARRIGRKFRSGSGSLCVVFAASWLVQHFAGANSYLAWPSGRRSCSSSPASRHASLNPCIRSRSYSGAGALATSSNTRILRLAAVSIRLGNARLVSLRAHAPHHFLRRRHHGVGAAGVHDPLRSAIAIYLALTRVFLNSHSSERLCSWEQAIAILTTRGGFCSPGSRPRRRGGFSSAIDHRFAVQVPKAWTALRSNGKFPVRFRCLALSHTCISRWCARCFGGSLISNVEPILRRSRRSRIWSNDAAPRDLPACRSFRSWEAARRRRAR